MAHHIEKFVYPAKLTRDAKGFFLVTFPDFSEAGTDARDKKEALRAGIDCLEETLAGRIRRGDDIPYPSAKKRGQCLITVPPQMAVKTALYLALKDTGLTKTEFASVLGADEKEVRRLLDPQHPSKLPRMQTALEALGKQLVIGVEAA